MRKRLCKRLFLFAFLMLFHLGNLTPVFAKVDTNNRLIDKANLLTDAEEEKLLGGIGNIQEKYNLDVVLLTVDSLEGKTPKAYAEDFYDYGGYGLDKEYSGILFLVSMQERNYYFVTTGKAMKIFTESKIDSVNREAASYLKWGEYAEGFSSVLHDVDKIAGSYQRRWIRYEGIAAAAALIIALLAVWTMARQMNNARKDIYAHAYEKDFTLSENEDVFLYNKVTKTRRESSSGKGGSSVHRGSSGRSHGGGGGSF